MCGRKPDRFVLKRKDKLFLQKLLRDGQTPWKVARRAQILLGRAQKKQSLALLMAKVEQDATTIWRVCERYRQGGLPTALYDEPRSGRPRVFFPPMSVEPLSTWRVRPRPVSGGR
jgi:hypothetical protein